jgi:hypothetical protein
MHFPQFIDGRCSWFGDVSMAQHHKQRCSSERRNSPIVACSLLSVIYISTQAEEEGDFQANVSEGSSSTKKSKAGL